MRFAKRDVRPRWWWLLVLLPLLALKFLPTRHQPPPNILVILIDTLRADRLGAYGNTQKLTPFMDELAEEGTVFRAAYSTTSWTSPAVASLFTSRYPSQHQIANYDSKIGDHEIMLAQRLRQAGYTTAAFLANYQVSRARGFAEGFSYWWEAQTPKTPAAAVREQVLSWLDHASDGERSAPKFLYVHFLDPHAPYAPPEPYGSRFEGAVLNVSNGPTRAHILGRARERLSLQQWDRLTHREVDLLESLYDGEVATVDAEIRLLLAELERRGFMQHAAVVLLADHGEEFREHGGMEHGRTLYNELVHIPLIVVVSGRSGGSVVHENVSLVDVAPTLLELAGAPPEPRFEGRSLLPLLADRSADAGDRHEPRNIIVELLPNGADHDLRYHARGIISGSTKLLVTKEGPSAAYDLTSDPGELNPSAAGGDGWNPGLAAALDEAERQLASRADAAGVAPLDEAAKEKLRALGYEP